jgi:hypothetical protein
MSYNVYMKDIIIRDMNDGSYNVYERTEADPYDDVIVTGASLHYALECARNTLEGRPLNGGAF